MIYFKDENMNKIDSQEHDKKMIQEMSEDYLRQYADETPIIRVDDFKKKLSDNGAYAGNIQNQCNLFNTQNNIHLESVTDIIPLQKNLRQHSQDWMDDMNKKLIELYARVKSFCFLLVSLENDIENYVNAVNSPNGRDIITEILNEFISECRRNSQILNNTSGELLDFSGRWQPDINNFKTIKQQLDDENKGSGGRIEIIQNQLSVIDEEIRRYDYIIIAGGILIGVGIIAIGAGVVLSIISGGVSIPLIATGLTIAGAGAGVFQEYMEKRRDAGERKIKLSGQLQKLNQASVVVDAYVGNLDALNIDNKKASQQVSVISYVWDEIAKNFEIILSLITGVAHVSDETKILIKQRLVKGVEAAKIIAHFARDCELRGTLPIKNNEEVTSRLLSAIPNDTQFLDVATYKKLINAQRWANQFKLV